MKKAGEIIHDPFVDRAWGFYNWIQGGMLHLTFTEYENIDQKLFDSFNAISSESQRMKDEEKEMQDIARGSLTDSPRRSIN